MDGLDAAADAMRALAATEHPDGPAFTLGPATGQHWCATCRTDSLIAADVLRIDDRGVTPIAVFYTCTNCQPDGSA